MSDPRLTPDPARVTLHDSAQVSQPIVDLRRTPDGPRDRQLLFGDGVTVLGVSGAWRYVQAQKDGYCGYVKGTALGASETPTHHVNAFATHLYEAADFKSQDLMCLSFGSRVHVTGHTGIFAETAHGFIPAAHLSPVSEHSSDPVEIATLFLGTPYLWGGNSRWGIDCSGLVQAALLACGIPCPGDSDLQQCLGVAATDGARRNDLLFWKGHVAIVVDAETLIHANAGSMSTRYEGIDAATTRISTAGDGPVTAHRRIL